MSATDDIAEVKLAGYFIEWDAIEDAKAKLAERSKDLGKAMKDEGFNTKAARTSFREQRADLNATQDDIAKAEEEEKVIDLYRAALKKGLASRAHPAPAHEKTLRNSGSKATSYAEAKGVETNSPSGNHSVANMESSHVDSSAERASSAVEFGATNSPETATISGGVEVAGHGHSPFCHGNRTDDAVIRAPSESASDEISATNSIQAGPHLSGVPGGERSTPSLDAGGAKMDEVPASPDRSDDKSGIHHAQSKQAAPNSDDVPATKFKEGCKHPGINCKTHFTSVLCSGCANERAKRLVRA